VIKTDIRNGAISRPVKHIVVGTEPYGLALTPNGRKLYVSNARSNTLSVIDTATDQVVKTIDSVGPEPRGLAISNDGDDDDADETVYVTQFLSLPTLGKVDGQDDAKRGFVTRVSSATDTVDGTIAINPILDTGFNALGDAIARIPPGKCKTTRPTSSFPPGRIRISSTTSPYTATSFICRTPAPRRTDPCASTSTRRAC
jgi:YVTN family beta-propeller protein